MSKTPDFLAELPAVYIADDFNFDLPDDASPVVRDLPAAAQVSETLSAVVTGFEPLFAPSLSIQKRERRLTALMIALTHLDLASYF